MATTLPKTHQLVWFIIDGRCYWNKEGWYFFFRTPLFGFTVQRNWPDWEYHAMKSGWWLGLICRQMADEGSYIYIWNWNLTTSRKPVISDAA